ncbi:MAG: MotA/TolQ/ExbB proton channel family protein [Xanthomonadales bacterium]|nr:MotA/TolQ/ExbB proton channel family protein [Xanthomonadales bacterium]
MVALDDLIGDTDSLALSKMGFAHLIQNIDVIGLTVLLTMAIMSILTWFYIFHNAFRLWSVRRRAEKLLQDFWESKAPARALSRLEEEPEYEPLSKIGLEAAQAASHHADNQGGRMAEALSRHEFIDRSIRQSVARESSRLESGLTLLATVGSTAPFVGLFGTVWGIYHALIGISASGEASLDVVAGPVGEALIMTCIGLGVAIPAVLAYNLFVRINGEVIAQQHSFAHDLLDYFATGERVRPQRFGTRKTA